jgi:CheY-like chemotaxis protein
MTDGLKGLNILIVEDEPLIAMALEDMLLDLGCALAGTAGTVPEGLALAAATPCDAAILDININGERSDPIAAVLAARGIPHIFATGYGRSGCGHGAQAIVIDKPYRPDIVAGALKQALAGG